MALLTKCSTCGRWRGTDEATGLELTSCTCEHCQTCGRWAPRLYAPPSTTVLVRLGRLKRCASCWRALGDEPAGVSGLELEDERMNGFHLGAVAGGIYRGERGTYCVLVRETPNACTLVHEYETKRTLRAAGCGRAVTKLLLALLAANEGNEQ